jgi:hypothetical protein
MNSPRDWSFRQFVKRWGCVVWPLLLFSGMFIALIPAVRNAREAANRSTCKGNIFSITHALWVYHEHYGSFPPPFVADADGRPMHSWRVLILPFYDKDEIYKEYRFDEPWDSAHNRKLADRIVWDDHSNFHCPGDVSSSGKRDPLMTSYLAVIGPGTAWPETGCTKASDVTDGPESTLLLVEVANSGIHWMEPRDLHVLQMTPTVNPQAGQGISSPHGGTAHVSTIAGRHRTLTDSLPAATIRGLLTIRGGEPISEDDF